MFTVPQNMKTTSLQALSQLRREHLEHEAEWQDKLQQATSRALLLSAELEEERAKSAECAKLLEVEKVLSQDAREADIHDKHAREEENQSLLHTYARLQERLDISDSKLALIQQFAMSDSALKVPISIFLKAPRDAYGSSSSYFLPFLPTFICINKPP